MCKYSVPGARGARLSARAARENVARASLQYMRMRRACMYSTTCTHVTTLFVQLSWSYFLVRAPKVYWFPKSYMTQKRVHHMRQPSLPAWFDRPLGAPAPAQNPASELIMFQRLLQHSPCPTWGLQLSSMLLRRRCTCDTDYSSGTYMAMATVLVNGGVNGDDDNDDGCCFLLVEF